MVEVFKAISRDGSTCYFGDKSAAAAWAGPRGRVEWEQFPEPPEFGVITGGGDPLAEVFNVMGIGSQARSVGVLLANIENLKRRTACLSAIEREFFTVQTPPDPDEDGDEPGEECLLRWGADPADYVEQFREALPGAAARGVMASDASRPFTGALNDVPATLTHDEGAYAQCGECGRYTLNPNALTDSPPPCDCGSKHGWSGSFKRPGPDAKWSGLIQPTAVGVVVDHALPTTPVVDHGPWSARKLPTGLKWCVESDDFTHDVMLIIDGDFADDDSRKAYAEGIAAQLNASGVGVPLHETFCESPDGTRRVKDE